MFYRGDAGLPGWDVAERETSHVLSGDSFCERDIEEAAGAYPADTAAGGQWFFRFGFAEAFGQAFGGVLYRRSPSALVAEEDLGHPGLAEYWRGSRSQ